MDIILLTYEGCALPTDENRYDLSELRRCVGLDALRHDREQARRHILRHWDRLNRRK